MTVGYLIDTDRVIDHFNGIRSVTERLQQLRSAGLAISIVSLAELYEGIHYSLEPTRTRPSCSGSWPASPSWASTRRSVACLAASADGCGGREG